MHYKDIEPIEKMSNSLDSLAPYVGKMRPELVQWLIKKFAQPNGIIMDPFSGSGTVLLEGWKQGYRVIGSDLNEYAIVLGKGKLNPYENEKVAIKKLEEYRVRVRRWLRKNKNEITVPDWVGDFFHPETLREIYAWTRVLRRNKEWFFLACLL